MKDLVRIHELVDSIMVEYYQSAHKGEYAYHLGDNKEVIRFFKRLLKVLNLTSIVEIKLK